MWPAGRKFRKIPLKIQIILLFKTLMAFLNFTIPFQVNFGGDQDFYGERINVWREGGKFDDWTEGLLFLGEFAHFLTDGGVYSVMENPGFNLHSIVRTGFSIKV